MNELTLFDSHCHLQDARFGLVLPGVIERAQNAGVTGFLCCGSTVEDWEDVQRIADTYPSVIPAFGLHPWYVDDAPADWLDDLTCRLQHKKNAVGEIGLDQMMAKSDFKTQQKVFEAHMELAHSLKLPVTIHCLKAYHHLIPVLKKYAPLDFPVQLHSYNGGPDQVELLADLGCYFSFSGSLTRSRNSKARQALAKVPLNKLLLETDAPDIPPEINGKIDFDTLNEPSNLVLVFKEAAQALNMDQKTLHDQLKKNVADFLAPLSQ